MQLSCELASMITALIVFSSAVLLFYSVTYLDLNDMIVAIHAVFLNKKPAIRN